MRRLSTIRSLRGIVNLPSFNIVYDWEDSLQKHLKIDIRPVSLVKAKWQKFFSKHYIIDWYHALVPSKEQMELAFVMNAETQKNWLASHNTIPVIIDFWLKKADLPLFFSAYRHVPLMLLTNLEVYTFLKENKCPFPIEHWPLSFPEKDRLLKPSEYHKEYEFCFFGRPNPFFIRLVEEYALNHPDFTYLVNKGDITHRYYETNRGEFIAKDTGRASYLDLLKKTKITCYTTPGIDEAKKETSQFNQVTPRLFEMICSGCQVIGHYPTCGEDVTWYQLDSIVPNVDTYDDFETIMDHYRSCAFDYDANRTFMNKHYTFARANMLINILRKHNIVIAAD